MADTDIRLRIAPELLAAWDAVAAMDADTQASSLPDEVKRAHAAAVQLFRDTCLRAATIKVEHAADPQLPAVKLGPLLFGFDRFNDWVNRAPRAWKALGVRPDDTLCIDAAGRICRIGRDFMLARDEGQFPVRVYLTRDDLPQYAAILSCMEG